MSTCLLLSSVNPKQLTLQVDYTFKRKDDGLNIFKPVEPLILRVQSKKPSSTGLMERAVQWMSGFLQAKVIECGSAGRCSNLARDEAFFWQHQVSKDSRIQSLRAHARVLTFSRIIWASTFPGKEFGSEGADEKVPVHPRSPRHTCASRTRRVPVAKQLLGEGYLVIV